MLPLLVLAHAVHHLLTTLLIPLMPMIRNEFQFDYTQSGLLLSVFNLTYGIGQLPAGWIADRIGRRIMITIGIAGVALCGLSIGISHTYLMLVIFLGLMGLTGGGYHPSASPVVAATVKPERRGSALGIHLFGGSTSHFLAPLLGVAIATALGWRGPYIVLAIPTFAFGILFYIVMGHNSGFKTTTPHKSETDNKEIHLQKSGRIRHLASLIVLSTFTQSVIFSIVSFIPLFLVDHFGISEEGSGAFIAIYFSTGLWASTLGGFLSDKFGRIRLIITVCLGAGILLYLFNITPFGIAMGALMLLIGTFGAVRMPVTESYIINNTSEKYRSTILGIYFFSGTGAGSVLTPLIGFIIDNFGFSTCFTVASISVIVVALTCWYFLRDSHDQLTTAIAQE